MFFTKKKIIKLLVIIFIIAFLMVIAITGYDLWRLQKNIRPEIESASSSFLRGVANVQAFDFALAIVNFQNASKNFTSSEEYLDKFLFLKYFPGLDREWRTTSQLLSVGITLSNMAVNVSDFSQGVSQSFKKTQTSLDKLDPQSRRLLIQELYESQPVLRGTKAEIDLALATLQNLPDGLVTFFMRKNINELINILSQTDRTLGEVIPLAEVFPPIAGYPDEKTYLFLLENNTELRPTGGFIGTYGLLKVNQGQIISFFTDDSYNLDRLVKPKDRPVPPPALAKYLGIERWYFRDVNWAPDFKEAAQLAEKFYQEESGFKNHLDGVLAITPDVVTPLLKILGPIQVDGIQFTADNFVETLEWQVEMAYKQAGIPRAQRKDIIRDLVDQFIEKLSAVSPLAWIDIIHSLTVNLDEKHILIYSNDASLQQSVELSGWAGRLTNYPGDYLMVVDANLASFKSDPVVERKINYEVAETGGDLMATVNLSYQHHGGFDWKTTRYRTYTRVYAPLGSELISSQGAMLAPKNPSPGPVETGQEAGKTFFGAFISIEPGETKTLQFKYKLPVTITDLVKNQSYQLLVQKQPGVVERDLTIRLNLGKTTKSWSPAGFGVKTDNGRIEWQTELRSDQQFMVNF